MRSSYNYNRRTISDRDIPITKEQIALLHVMKRDLKLDDDMYRHILELYGGVTSSKFLTLEGLKRVMKWAEDHGFKRQPPTKPKPGKGHPQQVYRAKDMKDTCDVITPAQQTILRHYFTGLGWTESERQRGFCKRMLGKPWPQTMEEAAKIIEALKAMVARNVKKE